MRAESKSDKSGWLAMYHQMKEERLGAGKKAHRLADLSSGENRGVSVEQDKWHQVEISLEADAEEMKLAPHAIQQTLRDLGYRSLDEASHLRLFLIDVTDPEHQGYSFILQILPVEESDHINGIGIGNSLGNSIFDSEGNQLAGVFGSNSRARNPRESELISFYQGVLHGMGNPIQLAMICEGVDWFYSILQHREIEIPT